MGGSRLGGGGGRADRGNWRRWTQTLVDDVPGVAGHFIGGPSLVGGLTDNTLQALTRPARRPRLDECNLLTACVDDATQASNLLGTL